jgi:GH24 family phage-related lysozyme (muramidase)
MAYSRIALVQQRQSEPWRQQPQQQQQQQGNPPANNPPDNHRPIRELSASTDLRTSLTRSERYVDHYYNDAPRNGNCTYGIGTLLHRGPCTPAELNRQVTPQQIEQAFGGRILEAEAAIKRIVHRPLTQGQFDALVSLTYNAGAPNARKLLDAISAIGPEAAALQILTTATTAWQRDAHAHVTHRVSRGLINRRRRELDIYQGRITP